MNTDEIRRLPPELRYILEIGLEHYKYQIGEIYKPLIGLP